MNASKLSRYLLIGAAALLPLARTARADDSADKPAAPANNRWAGWHIGVHGGHDWASADTTFDPLPSAATFVNLAPQTLEPDPRGSLYGVQVGYDWQHGIFVLGAEADYSHASVDGTTTVAPIEQNNGTPFPGVGNYEQTSADTTWLGSLRLRVGAAVMPNWILYGTIGGVAGHTNYYAITSYPPVGTTRYAAALSKTKHGLIGGVGTEVGIGNHFSLKLEYLAYDLGQESMTVDAVPYLPPFQVHYTWSNSGRTLNFGVNYKF